MVCQAEPFPARKCKLMLVIESQALFVRQPQCFGQPHPTGYFINGTLVCSAQNNAYPQYTIGNLIGKYLLDKTQHGEWIQSWVEPMHIGC